MGATLGVMLLMFFMSTLAINHVVLERRLQKIEQKYQKKLDRLVDDIEHEQTMRNQHRVKFHTETSDEIALATGQRPPITSPLIAQYAAGLIATPQKHKPQTSDLIAKYAASAIGTPEASEAPEAPEVTEPVEPATNSTSPIDALPQHPPQTSAGTSPSATFAADLTPKPQINSQIQVWANSRNQARIPALIKYAYHQDAVTRNLVAESLGKLASLKSLSPQAEMAIAVLGKLSRDRSVTVRQTAIDALGQIKSDRVLDFLMPALKSPHRSIVRSASGAIARLQYYQAPAKVVVVESVKKPPFKSPNSKA
ncbi:PBS lyase HEAT domain protein repeat-containing protein [Thalassoporum mexicanum PCC 7367]|uniref:HEAT repeat domain-containing protein n=1 Tax=Thalassoporum mexicanum TaxID=3457544 RepID=UPI00029FD9A6|nr:HEAT repeat domain-containing protein [Pseudanabaena sp. PCC 7367]AFY69352.1 PBS lyase HEAT domain protein repeat-containing protein [Pseudanabaena sp. PCC 7367]